MSVPTCLTIGHSGHSVNEFAALLKERGVEVVVDVRSRPYSKYHRHFSYDAIRENLSTRGLRYLFLGKELGGKPDDPEFYGASGAADYDRLRQSARFREGLERLIAGLVGFRELFEPEHPCPCLVVAPAPARRPKRAVSWGRDHSQA